MISIGKLDRGGVNKDIPRYDLPPQMFTDVLDVDFDEGGVVPAVDDVGVFAGVVGTPLYLTFVDGNGDSVLPVYLTATHAYVVLSNQHINITRTDSLGGGYQAGSYYKWNGGFFHGYMVWTNGSDVPQAWNPYKPEEPLIDLPNWPSSIRVALIRPFLNFLVGLGYSQQDGGTDAQTVIWSDITDPGTLPANWAIADPASKAGAFSLTSSSEEIVEAAELNGMLYIYKQTSTWTMRYVGGGFVMNFTPGFQTRGALGPRCVLPLANEHFCLDRLGFYIHNGSSYRDLGNEVIHNHFFDTLNPLALYSIFMVHEEAKQRVWVFFPSGTNRYADKVLIWAYKTNTWTFRSVQQAVCGASAAMDSYGSSGVWDQYNEEWGDDSFSWETDSSIWMTQTAWDSIPVSVVWDDLPTRQAQKSVHYASYVDPTTVTFDPNTGKSTDGVVSWYGSSSYPPIWFIPKDGRRRQGFLERINFSVMEQDASGGFSVDRTVFKHLTELYPEVNGAPLEVRWGTQVTANGPVTWSDWYLFSPEFDLKLDPNITEKFLAISFKGPVGSISKWMLTGYSLTIHNAGRY